MIFSLIYLGALVLFGATGFHVALVIFVIAVTSVLFFFSPSMIEPMAELTWSTMNNYVFIAMPLFILLGEIMLRSGVTERMYQALSVWMVRVPGRLLHSNIAACSLFAASTGSSVATAATIGTVALPALNARGYDRRLALGSLAAGGTLGILIPPSVNMIIYGVMTDTSIGRLFIAGVVPGLLLAGSFMLIIGASAVVRPHVAPFRQADVLPLRQRLTALPAIIPPLLVVLGVIGSIYAGLATPTEAAAVGVMVALLLAARYRRLSAEMMHQAFRSTIRTTGMVMLIIVAAFLMNFVIALLGIPQTIAEWVRSLGLTSIEVLWMLLFIYLVLGCFLEGFSMMITTIPIVAPLVFSLGVDLVWFGVFIVLVTELALITPPVGINLYVVQGIRTDGGSIADVIMGAIPFVITIFLFTIVMIYFPQIALWLPSQMMGR
ncbi:MAG: TRAP transporter large permease subunit [Proteobacteria bacterium]|nr:TRAP transporter large permease subunit [Pseudomonadota bacterium]